MGIGLNDKNETLIYETFDIIRDLVRINLECKLDMSPFGGFEIPEETYIDEDYNIRFTETNKVVEKGDLVQCSMASVSVMDLVHGYTPTYNDEPARKRRRLNGNKKERSSIE